MVRTNTTKAKMLAGGSAAGPIFGFLAPPLVEIAALAGFDYAFVDGEHGNFDHQAAEMMIRACEAANITSIARVPHNAPHEILRYLDLGVQGIVVPQINTADDALRAARAARYHPEGQRGLASPRASGYGLGGPIADYIKRANAETLVIALIEDIEAVRNLDAILDVDGIDVFTIGPSDLGQSLGYPGQRNHPELQAAIDTIIETGVRRGKIIGMNCPTAADVETYRRKGCRFFSVGAYHHLVAAWRDYMAAVNR